MCPERMKLLIDYRDATHRYAESVRDLAELVGLELNDDMEMVRRACRGAWQKAEEARVALVRHEGSHFCDSISRAS